MNSLFASNFTYRFQIFALTLFLVIHTEFAKGLVPFYYPLFHLLCVRKVIIIETPTVFLNKQS